MEAEVTIVENIMCCGVCVYLGVNVCGARLNLLPWHLQPVTLGICSVESKSCTTRVSAAATNIGDTVAVHQRPIRTHNWLVTIFGLRGGVLTHGISAQV